MPNKPAIYKQQRVKTKQHGKNRTPYNYRWKQVREDWLRANPLCVICMENGIITPAKEVDHIVAHKGNYAMFWDNGNLQSLCKSCHSTKTAKEDGGFGR